MSLVADLATIQHRAGALPHVNPLRLVLEEVSGLSGRIVAHSHIPTSGNAISRYYPAGHAQASQRAGWEIRYQDGNIGNLVHELTHAVTHRQYETDGVTYLSNNVVPVRTFTRGVGPINLAYCNNEELRQTGFMIPASDRWQSTNLLRLQLWLARDNGMTLQQKETCREKLQYGINNIYREYDTIINQILVWLYEWGFYPLPAHPVPPIASFRRYLEAAVCEAFNRRNNRLAINGAAHPVPAPPRRGRCYLTTACVEAKGLPDNCVELTVLRSFRDHYVRKVHCGERLIDEYYSTAPLILEKIRARSDCMDVLTDTYKTVSYCVGLIQDGRNEQALDVYMEMFRRLQKEWFFEDSCGSRQAGD